MDIVITCRPDGSVETLLKDSVFDTREVYGMPHRNIARISEILPEPNGMAFFIRWLRGPKAGTDSVECYPTYESAVAAEIASVNAARLLGASYS